MPIQIVRIYTATTTAKRERENITSDLILCFAISPKQRRTRKAIFLQFSLSRASSILEFTHSNTEMSEYKRGTQESGAREREKRAAGWATLREEKNQSTTSISLEESVLKHQIARLSRNQSLAKC
jgi:hypothetical protein